MKRVDKIAIGVVVVAALTLLLDTASLAASNVANDYPYNFAPADSIGYVREMPEYTDVSKDTSLIPPEFNQGYGDAWSRASVSFDENGFVTDVSYSDMTIESSAYKAQITTVTPYADGTIARLTIPKIKVNTTVREGETLDNLAKGAGHFNGTSQWDGNVGLCAHNRGVNAIFGSIHTLRAGDLITYETREGMRTYEVYYVGQISETDWSRLRWTETNIITLITCVANVPELRWCVQASEVVAK